MAVLFQFAFGGFPPFFPIIPNDIRHERLLDLVDRGVAAVAVEDEFDQFEMVGRGQLAQAFEIRRFARENMILGNGFERFRGERQVHGVARLVRENRW